MARAVIGKLGVMQPSEADSYHKGHSFPITACLNVFFILLISQQFAINCKFDFN